jgi:hypothetical protein
VFEELAEVYIKDDPEANEWHPYQILEDYAENPSLNRIISTSEMKDAEMKNDEDAPEEIPLTNSGTRDIDENDNVSVTFPV